MIALTVDCEQWVVPLLRGKNVAENNNVIFSKKGNEALLKIFDEFNIKATFFVTGYFAEKAPEQVREIMKGGHEIACHGYIHYYTKNFDLKKDIKKSKEAIEKITGKKIAGFRAPQMRYSKELLRVLEDLDFKYDSSLHSAFIPGSYNNSKYPLKIHSFPGLTIKEIPASAMPYTRFPISWLWMRNIGEWWTALGTRMLLRKKITPNIYFHSWEFAKIKSKNAPFYITRNTGEKFCSTLKKYLKAFKKENFVTLSELV